MPPLCNSDRVTTLAYVTHGPATPAAPSPAYPLPRKMIIMNQRVVVGVTGCYCVVTDAVTTATTLTPRVTAVTPRVTPRPMLPLCSSDRVTTLAYVTRGPARPRPNLLRNAPDNKTRSRRQNLKPAPAGPPRPGLAGLKAVALACRERVIT